MVTELGLSELGLVSSGTGAWDLTSCVSEVVSFDPPDGSVRGLHLGLQSGLREAARRLAIFEFSRGTPFQPGIFVWAGNVPSPKEGN